MSQNKPRERKHTTTSFERIPIDVLKLQQHYLEIDGDDGFKLLVELQSQEMIIGREGKVDIILPGDKVSRVHARIFRVGDEFYLEDLGSTNGTYLNNVQMLRSVLKPNDLVRIGGYTLFYQYREARDSD